MKTRKKLAILALSLLLAACGSLSCDNTNEGFQTGYEIGKNSVWATPEDHIRNCNNGYGMIGDVPDCWKEGYREGHKTIKHPLY